MKRSRLRMNSSLRMKMNNSGDKKPSGKDREEEQDRPSLGISGFLGIVLVAGSLFNLPNIMKIPETTADKMMLVIVLVMLIGGVILLTAGRKK